MSWTNLVPIATRCYKYYKHVWPPHCIFFDSGIASLLQPGHCLELADPKSQSRTSPSLKSTFCRCRQGHRRITLKARSGGTMWNWWVGRWSSSPMNHRSSKVGHFHQWIGWQNLSSSAVPATVEVITSISFTSSSFVVVSQLVFKQKSDFPSLVFLTFVWVDGVRASNISNGILMGRSCFVWPSDQPHLGFQVVVSLGQVTKRQVKLQLNMASSNESYQSHRSSKHLPPGNLT